MKKILSIILTLLLVFSLCACGSKSAPQAAPDENRYVSADTAPAHNPAAEEAGFDFATEVKAEGAETEVAAEGAENQAPEIDPEKIIYSAEITVETTEFEKSMEQLKELVAKYNGYIEQSSVNDANFYTKSSGSYYNRSADFTIRVPSSDFSKMNGDLSSIGNVPYSHTYTENVSAQYYDTEARLKAYTAQEERLLEMLDIAKSVEDIIAIEGELANVRYEIESLQSSLNNWDRRINYSTIYLNLQEVREYSDEPVGNQLSYGQQLLRSLKSGLHGVGRFFKDLLLWFVGALPALVIVVVLLLIFLPVFKKLTAKRRLKKEEKAKIKVKNSDTK